MNTTAKWTWALASEIVRAELERIRHSSDIRILAPDGTLLGAVSVPTRAYRDPRSRLTAVLPDPFMAKAPVGGPSVARQGARHGYVRSNG